MRNSPYVSTNSDLTNLFYNYSNSNNLVAKNYSCDAFEKFSNHNIPNYFAWHLNINDFKLSYIGNKNVCMNLRDLTLSSFKDKIHSSFQPYFTCILKEFFSEKHKGNFNDNKYLSFLFPFKLEGQTFKTTKFIIKPIVTNGVLTAFIIIVNPLEIYSNKHALNIEFYNNGIVEPRITIDFKKCIIEPHLDFTLEQRKTLELIESGLNCCEISEILCKSKHATFKINRRITDKISEFYEIEFKDSNEAVSFYKNCC